MSRKIYCDNYECKNFHDGLCTAYELLIQCSGKDPNARYSVMECFSNTQKEKGE